MKGGMLQGKAINNAQLKRMASLPSREQMLADFAAGMQSTMGRLRGRAQRASLHVCRRARRAQVTARRRLNFSGRTNNNGKRNNEQG